MENRRITRAPAWPWALVALLASVWLLAVFYLKQVVGPLNSDEVYFSHTLWLTLQGKRQFIDFYSQHFPTYFWLYDLVLPKRGPESLSFVWIVRASNVAVLAAYAALLFATTRRSALYLLPLLLLLIVVSRAIEVRSDTLGLLAFNAAWSALLVGKNPRWAAIATLLAMIGACFSARGLVMGAGFAIAVAWRAYVDRDWKAVLLPAILFACACAAALAAYARYPAYVDTMVQSTLLAPSALLSRLTFVQRVFAFDRLVQTLLASGALLIGIASVLKNEERGRSGVVAIACATQLLLIFLDPSPFPYVYAWALVPSLFGIVVADGLIKFDHRKWAAGAGALMAASIAAAIILYPRVTGRQPPAGSNYRLFLDTPLQPGAVAELPLGALVELMLSGEGQQSLSNQLMIRSEICRRLSGTVLAAWQNHPICAQDAAYRWFSVTWPNIGTRGIPGQDQGFAAIFEKRPPQLFIWDSGPANGPIQLNSWMLALLGGYSIENGFALRLAIRQEATDNSGRAASLPSNGRK